MKAVRTTCMVMLVAAPAVAFAQDKSNYPATPPLYDWSKFQPPETGTRISDHTAVAGYIQGASRSHRFFHGGAGRYLYRHCLIFI